MIDLYSNIVNIVNIYNRTNEYQSSEIDWCENNYQVSIYICEFMNTITSFSYIYIAIFGYSFFPDTYINKVKLDIIKYRYYKLYNYYSKIYFVLFFLGLFTFEFHLKLSKYAQIFDELSIIVLLLLLNLDCDLGKKRILFTTVTCGIILVEPKYNMYFLLGVGIIRWIELYKTVCNNKDLISRQIFETGSIYNFLALFYWVIDICLCDYLYVSTHFLWHIFSALSLHYYIMYTIWYYISHISPGTKIEDDKRYIIFLYDEKYSLHYTYNIEYYYGLPYIYYRCNMM
jgi:alkaline ceramidase